MVYGNSLSHIFSFKLINKPLSRQHVPCRRSSCATSTSNQKSVCNWICEYQKIINVIFCFTRIWSPNANKQSGTKKSNKLWKQNFFNFSFFNQSSPVKSFHFCIQEQILVSMLWVVRFVAFNNTNRQFLATKISF